MILEMDTIIEGTLEAIDFLTTEVIKDTGTIIPVAMFMVVSDGEDPKFQNVPEGEIARLTVPLAPLLGADCLEMLLELMSAVQYAAGNGDKIPQEVTDAVIALIEGSPMSTNDSARLMMEPMLEKTGLDERDIVVLALQRYAREWNPLGVVISLDSYYKDMSEEGAEMPVGSLADDPMAKEAHVLHVVCPNYRRIITKPYKITDNNTIVYEENITDMDLDDSVESRFFNIFKEEPSDFN